jgi:hypothetical protein
MSAMDPDSKAVFLLLEHAIVEYTGAARHEAPDMLIQDIRNRAERMRQKREEAFGQFEQRSSLLPVTEHQRILLRGGMEPYRGDMVAVMQMINGLNSTIGGRESIVKKADVDKYYGEAIAAFAGKTQAEILGGGYIGPGPESPVQIAR